MADAILKTCTRCGEIKDKSEFSVGQGKCRPCHNAHLRDRYANDPALRAKMNATARAWGAANKSLKATGDKAYRKANKDKVYARQREWKLANWEHHIASQLKSRHRNIDAYRAREAAYREANRVACNQRAADWKKLNPHACVAYAGKRRAQELQAIPSWADLDAIAAIYKHAQEMGCGFHVDHIVPVVSEKVCGLHCEANLQVIPAAENVRKSNRHWPDMWPAETITTRFQ